MKKTPLFLLAISSFIFNSCYYDSEEALFPANDTVKTECVPANVTFSGHIKPMIDNYCMSCHSFTVPVLDNYSAIVTYSERIYGDISHKSGYNPMPKNITDTIDTCLIKQFAKWIDEGKPNN